MRGIRFLEDAVYETDGPGKGIEFKKGEVLRDGEVRPRLDREGMNHDAVQGFLQRWTKRGVAVDMNAPPTQAETLAEVDRLEAERQARAEEEDRLASLETEESLMQLTRKELDALADERGVDISEANNKGDVVAALLLAKEGQADPAADPAAGDNNQV